MESQRPHLVKVYDLQKRLRERILGGSYDLDGNSLHIADVVATARYVGDLSQKPEVMKALQDSMKVVSKRLGKGWNIYGVNIGLGKSADTRAKQLVAFQASLMRLTQTGILSSSSDSWIPEHTTPEAWMRALMVVRCNATLRGHSPVSLPVLRALEDLLKHNLTPVVPLRGSVSALEDLMPLAYIAGALEGNPDILIERKEDMVPADQALKEAKILPILLGPEDGLGLIAGTASSAGLGALVVAEAHCLALLTQVLIAAAVEVLGGSWESFHPFIGQARPHPGQIECAHNICFFLHGSHLSRDVPPRDCRREDLEQDRYSLRSAPQWIGPQLEDLLSADRQISIELDSSCDEPLIDSSLNELCYGGNFHAACVTSAMEKVRLSLQMFGRLHFAMSKEMTDPTLSGGLPLNFAVPSPSLSFTREGVDINMAAYMAELSRLASPISNVQMAGLYNQVVNPMALASARTSAEAIGILIKMGACSIYTVCQALDLGALHMDFIAKATDAILSITQRLFSDVLEPKRLKRLQTALQDHIRHAWRSKGQLELGTRCESLVKSAVPTIVAHIKGQTEDAQEWEEQALQTVLEVWQESFESFLANPHISQLLGKGSSLLYHFVRTVLEVPFHEGFIEQSTNNDNELRGRAVKTAGGLVSIIHDSIKDGSLYTELMALAKERFSPIADSQMQDIEHEDS